MSNTPANAPKDPMSASRADENLKLLEVALAAVRNHTTDIERHRDEAKAASVVATTALGEISNAVTVANAAKTQIADSQAVIATKSSHIQAAQEHADKVRGDLDRVLTDAKQNANETDGQKKRAQAAADTAAESLAGVRASKGAVEVEALAVAELRKQAAQAATEVQARTTEIAGIVTAANTAKTEISDTQAAIAKKAEAIQATNEHIEKMRGEFDRSMAAANKSANESEVQRTRAQTAADAANETLNVVRAAKAAAESEANALKAARKLADESAAVTKSLAERAATIEQRVAAYEKRLAELDQDYKNQLATIVGLLPGATSAGLAHSFDERRQTFLKPQNTWQWVFVGSLGAIVLLTITGLWHVIQSGTVPSYDELVRLWLARIPVIGALVWLALHASRESALAKRLEEDYGYKSAISTCFEGFKKQMSEIKGDVAADSALAKLLDNTLAIIAAPPGRIYDKHELSVSPSKEATDTAKAVAQAIGGAKEK